MTKTVKEIIDEISKKTLSNYIDKSFEDGNKAHKEIKDAETPEEKESAEKRLSKRNQGVIKASKKYFKEDNSLSENSKHSIDWNDTKNVLVNHLSNFDKDHSITKAEHKHHNINGYHVDKKTVVAHTSTEDLDSIHKTLKSLGFKHKDNENKLKYKRTHAESQTSETNDMHHNDGTSVHVETHGNGTKVVFHNKNIKEDVDELDEETELELTEEQIIEMAGAGVTARDVHRHLKSTGWTHARSSGGHDVFTHEKSPYNIAVPRHKGDLNRQTVLQILKKSKVQKNESVELAESDAVDIVAMDVPLFIRLLEYAREDAVDDAALHKLTEKVIAQAKSGTLTMDSYTNLIKESVESDHLQNTLADKDIDSKIEGDKVIVHKDNVSKARAHVKKLGLDHKVVAGLTEETLVEEVRLLKFSEYHLLETFDEINSLEEDLSDKLQHHMSNYRDSGHEVKLIDRGSDGKTAKFISKNKSGKVRMHIITPTSARHEVIEPGDDHDEDDKPKGRGRPVGSKSGSRY